MLCMCMTIFSFLHFPVACVDVPCICLDQELEGRISGVAIDIFLLPRIVIMFIDGEPMHSTYHVLDCACLKTTYKNLLMQ